jgi:FkbM family methyltransferase
MNQNSSLSKIAIEVGSHRGKQCLQAAISKLESYCLEPSPESFAKVRKRVNRAAGIKHRVHLYQAAAGEKTGEFVQFKSKGGTGDSVLPLKVSNSSFVVNVPTLRLDDLVANISGCDGIYLLKIDTQGYEPMVFKGLQSSLERLAIDFIIFEFWPRGMNQFVHENGTTCIGADLLMSLLRIGYKLYPTSMSSHHSLSPKEARKYLRSNPERPYHDIVKYCQWHLDLEEQFPAPNYTIGYWSDIVAVSPKMRLQTPQTNTGQALFPPRR